ncbi:MAG: hypothetical protein ABIP94_15860, partial [Planctomycetota bacterium]
TAERTVLAAGTSAWPLLVDRYRTGGDKAPDRLVRLLGRVGRVLPEAEHREVRHALAANGGDTWTWARMSWTTSRGGHMTGVHREAYARLTIGCPDGLDAFAAYLLHDNAAVRLAAAHDLAERSTEIAHAPADPATERARNLLVQTVRSEHPKRSPFERGEFMTVSMQLWLDEAIQAAAAAALLECEQTPETKADLLSHVLAHDDPDVVARAIERWATADSLARVESMLESMRPAVRQAATAAIERVRRTK